MYFPSVATFNVWATLLTEDSVNRLVGKLLDSHCTVTALAEDGKMGVMGETACLLAIKVVASWKNTTTAKQKTKMINFIKECCDDLDAHYFSIVVTDTSSGSTWSGEAPGNRQN